MGGFIILNDGRAYAVANWAYRATLEAIANALPATPEGEALGEWLRNDPLLQAGFSVDLRDLTPPNREMILTAIEQSFVSEKARGSGHWHDPAYWPGWINRFEELVKMVGCVRRGEPPEDYNPHMKSVLPPSNIKDGPGW